MYIMQVTRLLVGPIPTVPWTIDASSALSSSSIIYHTSLIGWANHNRKKWVPASSSYSSLSAGQQDHYAVLGLARNASSADIKKAYRLLAREYHPDVSKHSQAVELFKRIRHAYEILSNTVTRSQYDRALRYKEGTRRLNRRNHYYSSRYENRARIYRWAKLRQHMQHERYWEQYEGVDEDSSSHSEMEETRGPFSEMLRSAFITLFLLQTLGCRLSLTFSSLLALFDLKLDAGYKVGHLVAWVLGGRVGILLTLCLQFVSWLCGKTSSSIVTVVVVAMWIGSTLARNAPLPQGALLALLYMSIKLQVDIN
ncbi:hypothetical protein K2173_026832 [Erythroxylum novogranatense]|uniref:J domain-containing protein n=1 Tax=Erythroxylum novogranatense TaxID=1862640 RepID=A0AAV8TXF1_9ROSI|nr:hypothetical protein K2173_026832 [Erythroxylum novogranatense]